MSKERVGIYRDILHSDETDAINLGLQAEDLLKPFCECDGVSGFEHEGKNSIGEYIIKSITPYCDELYIDRAGNIIAFKKGAKKLKTVPHKVLLAAHMDEVGFVIKHISDDGTLLFDGIGISPSAMPCGRVRIGDKMIHGVIGMTPVHLVSKSEREKPVSADSLFIDIGASGKEEAEKYVAVGDRAVFDNGCELISATRMRGKAIDDRIGCALLCRIMRENLPYDTYFAFTVREELGTLGASAAINAVKPEYAIVIEATTASDIPGCEGHEKVCCLGGGVVLPTIDGGTSYDKGLGFAIRTWADQIGVRIQNKRTIAGGTDARTFQRASGAVKVLGVALPCRYIHTASCVADVGDILAMEKLVGEIARRLGEGLRNVALNDSFDPGKMPPPEFMDELLKTDPILAYKARMISKVRSDREIDFSKYLKITVKKDGVELKRLKKPKNAPKKKPDEK